MQRIERFLETPFGRLHCVEQGEGPALLLLHSNGCSWHEYEQVLPLLAPHMRCIAWDLPGHGDSERSGRHLSIEDYAQATLALMDALDLGKAHICGASVGGFICMALARAAPARADSVVIVEAALRTPAEWEKDWDRIESQFAMAQQGEQDIAPRFRHVTPALLRRWNVDRAKAGGWRMVDVMWAIRDYDAMAELARVQVPAVVVIGDKGPVSGGRERYAKALPRAPLHVIADAGHFPMMDAPAEFAQAVLRGIGSVTAQA